eukprot:scaffold329996_cov29-Prasinocladus_malaysianus.AAC.1
MGLKRPGHPIKIKYDLWNFTGALRPQFKKQVRPLVTSVKDNTSMYKRCILRAKMMAPPCWGR